MLTDEQKQLKAEIHSLLAGRDLFTSIWDDCAKACNPRIARQIVTPQQNYSPQTADIKTQLDTTAMQANQTLAGGQMAHITPMGSEWFRLEPPDSIAHIPAAITYYNLVTVAIRKYLANSNFYNVMHEQYLDHGAFGTSAMEIIPGRDNRGLHFRPLQIGSYAIAEDHYGVINTIARQYQVTAQQAAGLFDKATLPDPILQALDKGDRGLHTFTHYIRPNPDYDAENPFTAPYQSFDICDHGDKGFYILRKSRFNEIPISVSRWMKWGENCPYGFPPALIALPPHKQASYLETLADYLGELSAFPRSLIPSSLKGEIDLRPGGVTFYDQNMGAQEMPREWLTGGSYQILQDRLARKKEQIEQAFFVPLFELITQQTKQMTAFEVQQRVAEKGALFHPIFVRTVTEKLTPTILRAYSILARQPGALPAPPPEVITQKGRGPEIPDPEVRYVSPLALAITQTQVSGLPSVLQTLALIAQADPSVYKSVKTENLFPELARAAGLPETFIRTPEEIKDIDAAQAQQQQIAQAEQMASAAGKLGGAPGIQQLADMAAPPQ